MKRGLSLKHIIKKKNYLENESTTLVLVVIVKSCNAEAYSEPCNTFNMENFPKLVNSLYSLIIFAKHSIYDVSLGFEYASVINIQICCYIYFDLIKNFLLFV